MLICVYVCVFDGVALVSRVPFNALTAIIFGVEMCVFLVVRLLQHTNTHTQTLLRSMAFAPAGRFACNRQSVVQNYKPHTLCAVKTLRRLHRFHSVA